MKHSTTKQLMPLKCCPHVSITAGSFRNFLICHKIVHCKVSWASLAYNACSCCCLLPYIHWLPSWWSTQLACIHTMTDYDGYPSHVTWFCKSGHLWFCLVRVSSVSFALIGATIYIVCACTFHHEEIWKQVKYRASLFCGVYHIDANDVMLM